MSAHADRTFFSVAAVLTLGLGAAWCLAPGAMYGQWGVADPSPIAVYMARRYATMFFGYTVLLWLARDATASPAGRAIAAGGVVVTAVMAAVSAWGAISGVAGPMIWSATVIEIVLAVFFARAWRRA